VRPRAQVEGEKEPYAISRQDAAFRRWAEARSRVAEERVGPWTAKAATQVRAWVQVVPRIEQDAAAAQAGLQAVVAIPVLPVVREQVGFQAGVVVPVLPAVPEQAGFQAVPRAPAEEV
jgi:hypothetical protein